MSENNTETNEVLKNAVLENEISKENFLVFFNRLFSTNHKKLIKLKASEINYEFLFLNSVAEEEEKIVSIEWMNAIIILSNELHTGLSNEDFMVRYHKLNSGFF